MSLVWPIWKACGWCWGARTIYRMNKETRQMDRIECPHCQGAGHVLVSPGEADPRALSSPPEF